ncbi:MAG: flagella synthesis protein FlgN [Pseudomonadota bacterium]
MAAPHSDSADVHALLLEQFSRLLDTLQSERRALVERTPDALEEIVARKESLCREISEHQHVVLAELQPDGSFPESMRELGELAEQCRALNSMNGRIAQRARQTTRTLLGILTGEPKDALYHRGGGTHDAAATPGSGHRLGSA